MKMKKLAVMLALSLTLQSVVPMCVMATETAGENTVQTLDEAENERISEKKPDSEAASEKEPASKGASEREPFSEEASVEKEMTEEEVSRESIHDSEETSSADEEQMKEETVSKNEEEQAKDEQTTENEKLTETVSGNEEEEQATENEALTETVSGNGEEQTKENEALTETISENEEEQAKEEQTTENEALTEELSSEQESSMDDVPSEEVSTEEEAEAETEADFSVLSDYSDDKVTELEGFIQEKYYSGPNGYELFVGVVMPDTSNVILTNVVYQLDDGELMELGDLSSDYYDKSGDFLTLSLAGRPVDAEEGKHMLTVYFTSSETGYKVTGSTELVDDKIAREYVIDGGDWETKYFSSKAGATIEMLEAPYTIYSCWEDEITGVGLVSCKDSTEIVSESVRDYTSAVLAYEDNGRIENSFVSKSSTKYYLKTDILPNTEFYRIRGEGSTITLSEDVTEGYYDMFLSTSSGRTYRLKNAYYATSKPVIFNVFTLNGYVEDSNFSNANSINFGDMQDYRVFFSDNTGNYVAAFVYGLNLDTGNVPTFYGTDKTTALTTYNDTDSECGCEYGSKWGYFYRLKKTGNGLSLASDGSISSYATVAGDGVIYSNGKSYCTTSLESRGVFFEEYLTRGQLYEASPGHIRLYLGKGTDSETGDMLTYTLNYRDSSGKLLTCSDVTAVQSDRNGKYIEFDENSDIFKNWENKANEYDEITNSSGTVIATDYKLVSDTSLCEIKGATSLQVPAGYSWEIHSIGEIPGALYSGKNTGSQQASVLTESQLTELSKQGAVRVCIYDTEGSVWYRQLLCFYKKQNPKNQDSNESNLEVVYHTQDEIIEFLTKSNALKSDSITFDAEPSVSAPYRAGALSNTTLESAAAMLNQVRYIAGLPYNVSLNDDYNEKCQAAVLVNYVNGKLSHTPAQPSDMESDLYDLGYAGASNSNIAWTSQETRPLNETVVDSWMADEDSSNISRVGHRRWVLNPSMGKIGFGAVNGSKGIYSAMYAMDNSGSGSPFGVAWPAQNMPVDYFDRTYPWSVSTGETVDASKIKVKLTREKDGKVWNFSQSAADGYFNVNNDNYGQTGCIIFRPNVSDIASYESGDSFLVEITKDDEAYIKYKVNFFDATKNDGEYTVTFNSNGGTTVEKQTVLENGYVSEPDKPTKEGYLFGGWYKDAVFQSKWDFAYDTVSSNITLYAKWTKKSPEGTCTIKYDLQGHGSNIASVTVKIGEKLIAPAVPIAEGYTFEGWYKEAECKTAWKFATDIVTEDITLYAKWIDKTAKVTFNLQGHGSNIASVTVKIGEKLTAPAVPIAEGYTFLGWYKEAECKTAWKFDEDIVNADITLYAGWKYSGNSDESSENIIPGDLPDNGIPEGLWIAGIKNFTYTGKAIKPQVRVYYENKRLIEGQDYTINYKNNTKAASAADKKAPTVTIKGKGNYAGTATKTFTINQAVLTVSNLKAASAYQVGKAYTPVIMLNGNILKIKTDYTLTYKDDNGTVLQKKPTKEIGRYIMHIEGKGNCAGSFDYQYDIVQNGSTGIEKGKATVGKMVYGGEYPSTVLRVNGKTLTTDDYVVVFSNTNAKGTATATFIGTGNYTGVLKKKFKVSAQSLQNANITVADSAAYEKGGAKPKISVTANKTKLSEGVDYTVSYKGNTKPGNTARVIVKGKGNYNGSKSAVFQIKGKALNENDMKILIPDVVTGKKPVVTIYDTNGKKLSSGSDYKVDIDKSAHTVTITGGKNGFYSGTIVKAYKELAADKIITSVKLNKNASGFPKDYNAYTGKEITLRNEWLTVKAKNTVLPSNSFTLDYVNNIKKGTATVIVQGINGYSGIKMMTFQIKVYSLKNILTWFVPKSDETEDGSFAVTFIANGGKWENKEELTVMVENGSIVALPDEPVRVGYIFTGWQDSNGNVFSKSTPVTKDMTVYAQWETDGHIYADPFELPALTGDRRTDFVAIAMSQVGYVAASDGSTYFGAWAGDPYCLWCSEFVAWCAEQANIPKSVIPKGTSARKYRNFFASKGRYYYIEEGIDGKNTEFMSGYDNIGTISIEDLEAGDILLQETDGNINNGPDHTAIFLKYENGKVECVSGNSKSRVMVYRCKVEKFHGVCRPSF